MEAKASTVDPDALGVGSRHVMFRPLNPWILVGPTRHSVLAMLVCNCIADPKGPGVAAPGLSGQCQWILAAGSPPPGVCPGVGEVPPGQTPVRLGGLVFTLGDQ